MVVSTFLLGAVFGAVVATLLSSADHQTFAPRQIPLSLEEALSQIKVGWAGPTAIAWSIVRHPLVLIIALLLLLGLRRLWRGYITRPLWVQAPQWIKALLELHSSVLGGLVVISLVVGASIIASQAHAHDAFFWHPTLVGLAAQLLLPVAIHPSLGPRLAHLPLWLLRWLPKRNVSAPLPMIWLLRTGSRVTYGAVLLLSVLWVVPLTIEAAQRWWQAVVISELDLELGLALLGGDGNVLGRGLGGIGGRGLNRDGGRSGGKGSRGGHGGSGGTSTVGCSGEDGAAAERAAATLATLACFAMIRRVGKSLDLQMGHYYWSDVRDAGETDMARDAAQLHRADPRSRRSIGSGRIGGLAGSDGGIGSIGAAAMASRPGERASMPAWLRAYLRSVRWCAVTPPTAVVWYAMSVEMRTHSGWQRLLLPTLLFALNECGQTIRLFTLLVVHEGFSLHEHLRLRSAHWLHRLELFAALHWVGLAGAVLLPGSVFGAAPPPASVLLALPCACLVAITVLEQLPGDASELDVLLRHSARANVKGDLAHLCSGNSWYRGLLDVLVVDPESLRDVTPLSSAQRNLPWWLRPPLPDSDLLRRSYGQLTSLAAASSGSLDGLLSAGGIEFDAQMTHSLPQLPTASRLLRAASGMLPRSFSRDSLPTISRSPSTTDLFLALARPASQLTNRLLAALPSDLSVVVSEVASVLYRDVLDRGSKQTSERQIREGLRVLGSLASHIASSTLFSWEGRRRLLGGLAALEEMLSVEAAAARDAAPAASPRPGLPRLLALLASRERIYMERVRESVEPVGRHATGAGRSAARDPLSFGLNGSFVLDEEAEKALKARGTRPTNVFGLERVGGEIHGGGGASAPSAASSSSETANRLRWPSWLPWAQNSSTEAEAAAVPTVGLLAERYVPLDRVYEIRPTPKERTSPTPPPRATSSSPRKRPSPAGRSFAHRIHEMQERQTHDGISGTRVLVQRYPPTFTSVPPHESLLRAAGRNAHLSPWSEGEKGDAQDPAWEETEWGAAAAEQALDGASMQTEDQDGPNEARRAAPLWFHAVVTALHYDTQTCDIEYQVCAQPLAKLVPVGPVRR